MNIGQKLIEMQTGIIEKLMEECDLVGIEVTPAIISFNQHLERIEQSQPTEASYCLKQRKAQLEQAYHNAVNEVYYKDKI